MIEERLQVASEFSRHLGGRYRDDGPWSGEQFRDDLLLPRVQEAMAHRRVLHVIFDGVAGMPSSFLEEAFGGLLRARKDWTPADLWRVLKLEAPNSPQLWPFLKLAERFVDQEAARQRH